MTRFPFHRSLASSGSFILQQQQQQQLQRGISTAAKRISTFGIRNNHASVVVGCSGGGGGGITTRMTNRTTTLCEATHGRRMFQSPIGRSWFSSTTTTTTTANSTTTAGATTTTTKSKSWLMRFIEWYSHQLDVNPWTTKSITTGLIAGTGDFMCQAFILRRRTMASTGDEEDDAERKSLLWFGWWDPIRTGRFATIGICYVGPTVHVWFGWLARAFPGKGVGTLATRVALDQAIFTTAFMMVWLPIMWTLESTILPSRVTTKAAAAAKEEQDQKPDMVQRLQDEIPGIMIANWYLWIPAQFINFGLVPVKFQVLFSNAVALMWNAYLSYRTAMANAHLEQKQMEAYEQQDTTSTTASPPPTTKGRHHETDSAGRVPAY